MSKIRILLCIDSVRYDAGPDKQLAEIIKHMDKDRFEVHLCCFEDSPRMREVSPHCATLILPMVRAYMPRGLWRILQLRRYINRNDIQIVQNFLVKANIVGVLAARRSRCKIILSSRRDMGFWLTPIKLRFQRYLDRYCTRLVANSERVKAFVLESERVPAEKVDVLYNGVDLAGYAASAGDPSVPRAIGIPDSAKVVGMVANLRAVKDQALFLRAAAIVARRVPDAAFVLVGIGVMRDELGRLASELGIADKVFFSDGRGRVQDYLRRMSIGCLSSTATCEGFSNALIEYMAAGLPVVATDVGGNAEAIRHGETGYVVSSRDPVAFAEPLIELLTDEAKRAEMGRRSLGRCRQEFELGAAVRRHEDYYAALVGGLGARNV